MNQKSWLVEFREKFTHSCPEIKGRRDLKTFCGTEELEAFIGEKIDKANDILTPKLLTKKQKKELQRIECED